MNKNIFATVFLRSNILRSKKSLAWLMCFLCTLCLAQLSSYSFAAISPEVKSSHLFSAPVALRGGQAGRGFSLLNIEKSTHVTGVGERFIFSIGDINGLNIKGLPGYYHAQLSKNPNQISLDFSQLSVIYMNDKQIQEIFSKSKYVKSYNLITDPIDKTTTLILHLNQEVRFRALQVKGEKMTSRVVLDIL